MSALSRTILTSTSIALVLGLAACGGGGDATAEDESTAAASESAAAPIGSESEAEDASLVWEDAWVKAADEGMTGAFGRLRNDSENDISVTGAASPVAGFAELHETVSDDGGSTMMQEKEGGFVVPAGGELTFEPGGDHVMLMDLQEPIVPGDEVAITLTTDAGDIETTVVAKEFTGAQEEYVQGHGGEDGASEGEDSEDTDGGHGDHDH